MPPPLVILVRHGESEHHVRRMTGGWTDTPLTAKGHEQSKRVASRLKSEVGDAPIALYTSDLQRAAQTAAHIATAFGVEPIVDARLREHNNGAAADMTLEDARGSFPAFFELGRLDDRPVPGCESRREFSERAGSFLDDLHDDARVTIVVSHGGTIECMIARWLGLTPEAAWSISLGAHTTGVTTLRHDMWDRPMVERMNDVGHLHGVDGWVSIGHLLPGG